jgi:glycosyltransferase involved in cell wall biosynthesis
MSAVIRRVGLVSPGWPLAAVPSGIVSYVDSMRTGFASIGVDASVLSIANVEARSRCERVINLERDVRRGVIEGVFDRVLERIDPQRQSARSVGRAITSALKANPDIQLLEIEESFGFARWIRSSHSPVIVRLHGPWFINGPASGVLDGQDFQKRCQGERLGIESSAGVSAPSASVLERTLSQLQRPPKFHAVIPNPTPAVDPSLRWRIDAAAPQRILYVGRFERLKGPDILLHAFAHLLASHKDAELIFVGPDNGFLDGAGRIWSLTEYLGSKFDASVRAKIKVLGAQPGDVVRRLRRECRVAVVSSRQESFGIAVVESLAVGAPTIGAAVGGVPEIIQDERNGLLFKPEDSQHLASQLRRVFDSPELALALSEAGLQSASRFYPTEVARKTLGFYDTVMEGQAARRNYR